MTSIPEQSNLKQYASVWTALHAPESAMPKTLVSKVRNKWIATTKNPVQLEKANQHLTSIEQKLLAAWVISQPQGISAELFLKVLGLMLEPHSTLTVFDEDLGYSLSLSKP